MTEGEKSAKEVRIRALTKLYYSKPDVQRAIFEFGQQREVVPRYFESFGKRPDALQYPADVSAAAQRGATSFHASEEIWHDPLRLNTDMTLHELHELRSGWDLLLDIDSPYLDYSQIAAQLIVRLLEEFNIKSYGIKFSGSKGFHLIVPWAAFPKVFDGAETRLMFPEWPRAVCEYILSRIKPEYNKAIIDLGVNFKAVQERTKLSKEELLTTTCPQCGKPAQQQTMYFFTCDRCAMEYQRPNVKITKKRLRCTDELCSGFFDVVKTEDYLFCPNCKTKSSSFASQSASSKKVIYEVKDSPIEFKEEFSGEKLGSLDLVLVSSRHLFRMPYSLHEKTALASVVIKPSDLATFTPKDADPLKVKVVPFGTNPRPDEAAPLLAAALEWKKQHETVSAAKAKPAEEYEEMNFEGVTEEMFPKPIKKLLNGLVEGRKRGLFILLTFLRSLNFQPAYIEAKVREWNAKNDPPLKEGYIKSQVDWIFRQKKKILPPNYANPSFYKDLNLLDSDPSAKNPIVEVARALRKQRG